MEESQGRWVCGVKGKDQKEARPVGLGAAKERTSWSEPSLTYLRFSLNGNLLEYVFSFSSFFPVCVGFTAGTAGEETGEDVLWKLKFACRLLITCSRTHLSTHNKLCFFFHQILAILFLVIFFIVRLLHSPRLSSTATQHHRLHRRRHKHLHKTCHSTAHSHETKQLQEQCLKPAPSSYSLR
jgi:hypothetical protein